jgi:hypothetical protein
MVSFGICCVDVEPTPLTNDVIGACVLRTGVCHMFGSEECDLSISGIEPLTQQMVVE